MSGPFFDTNIIIDWLQDRPGASDEIAMYSDHRISRVVWSEVMAGERPERRDQVRNLLARFDIVEIDERIAMLAADIRHRTRMKLLDAFILATARLHGTLLITRNTKDFPASMPGIRVPYTL